MSAPHETVIRVLLAARPDLIEVLDEALRAPGIRVVASCTDRTEALSVLGRVSPDVCIVDRELEGGGLIAAAAMASPRRAPKVLVVGDNNAAAEQRAAQLGGAAAYLPRSSDPAAFVAAVTKLVTEPPTRR